MGDILVGIQVYMAKHHKDKAVKCERELPPWLVPIQVGAGSSPERVAEVLDCRGGNISSKNGNYSELTALYWIWKNCLANHKNGDYYGMFHYRRWLDFNEAGWHKAVAHDIDAVLPYPTVHEPDIRGHHARYIKGADWDAALQALKELAPQYYEAYENIFSQEYLFNYNILIAKASVLEEYCRWLFPILSRVEELSDPPGSERADRYIGYIGENLLTLYFMYHRERLNIVHTGIQMIV